MHTYDWSCLACGNSNTASALQCVHCGCPARCTVAAIEHYRASYKRTGQALGESPGLLRDPTDVIGVQFVFGLFALLLLGWWPFEGRSSSNANSSAQGE